MESVTLWRGAVYRHRAATPVGPLACPACGRPPAPCGATGSAVSSTRTLTSPPPWPCGSPSTRVPIRPVPASTSPRPRPKPRPTPTPRGGCSRSPVRATGKGARPAGWWRPTCRRRGIRAPASRAGCAGTRRRLGGTIRVRSGCRSRGCCASTRCMTGSAAGDSRSSPVSILWRGSRSASPWRAPMPSTWRPRCGRCARWAPSRG